MANMIAIYALAILASTAYAIALSLIGIHLAARDRSMQALCAGQGAMFGTLVGIGLVQQFSEILENVAPFITAAIGSMLAFFLSEKFVGKKKSSRNTYFIAIFSILVAFSHLVSCIFPSLESHMAQRYFGDLATMSTQEGKVIIAVAILSLIFLFARCKALTRESFDSAILGYESLISPSFFGIIALVVIALSVQVLGFLFTMSCLFLPTAFAAHGNRSGLWQHIIFCILIAGVSTALGFILSLYVSHAPTVPVIVLTMLMMGVGTSGLSRWKVFG